MIDVHPTSTAGDGRLKPRRTTYKPKDRIIELRSCAQCGFPFRVGYDTEADSIDNGAADQNTVINFTNSVSKLPQPLKNMAKFQSGSVNFYDSSSTTGCRFCHSLNPQGHGRNDRAFDSGVDLSNR